MNRFIIFTLFTLISITKTGAQSIKVFVEGTDIPQVVYLGRIVGDEYAFVDSTFLAGESVEFQLDKWPKGVYRIIFKRSNRYFPFINDKTDIVASTTADDPFSNLMISESIENIIYTEFSKYNLIAQRRLELLHPLLDNYPSEPFLESIKLKYNKIQKSRNEYIDSLAEFYPDLLATKLALVQRRPFIDAFATEQERIGTFQEDYFKLIDFSYPELIYSNAYNERINEYFNYLFSRKISSGQMLKDLQKAVDDIMLYASANHEVYDFVINYLISGFERSGLMDMVDYIAINYETYQCKSEADIPDRINRINALSRGMTAPDFSFTDIHKKEYKLHEFISHYTILVFWASWCPHCEDLLERLKEWYKVQNKKEYTIITISIDESKEDWSAAIETSGCPWICTHTEGGWNADLAIKYNITGTPTVFVLDKKKQIISKPITFNEFEDFFRDH